MSNLNELLERVKAATGPDRELDHALWLHFDETAKGKFEAGRIPLPWMWCLTASVDDALALLDRELSWTCCPGFQQNPDKTWSAAILRLEPDDGECPTATAPTAPLAILAATLSALALPLHEGSGE